jgi:hypothetical protein
MAELGKYTRALQTARLGRRTAQLINAHEERRHKRWLAAKKRALEMLRQTDLSCSNEAKESRGRLRAAKRRAIGVLNKTRYARAQLTLRQRRA